MPPELLPVVGSVVPLPVAAVVPAVVSAPCVAPPPDEDVLGAPELLALPLPLGPVDDVDDEATVVEEAPPVPLVESSPQPGPSTISRPSPNLGIVGLMLGLCRSPRGSLRPLSARESRWGPNPRHALC